MIIGLICMGIPFVLFAFGPLLMWVIADYIGVLDENNKTERGNKK